MSDHDLRKISEPLYLLYKYGAFRVQVCACVSKYVCTAKHVRVLLYCMSVGWGSIIVRSSQR